MEKTCRVCVALLCSILVAGQQQEEQKDPLVGLMLNKMKQNHQLTPEASSASEKKILEASRASTPAPTPPPPPPPTRLKVGSQASRPSEQKQDAAPKREGLAGLMKNKVQEDQNAEALETARKEKLEDQRRAEEKLRAAKAIENAKAMESKRVAQEIEGRRKAAQEIEERRQRAEASSRAAKEIEERRKLAAQENKQQATARAAIEIEERRKRAEAANRGAQLVQSKQQANARAASEIEERRKRAEAARVAQEVNSRREANTRAAQEIEERRQRAEASRRVAQEAEDRQVRAEANRRAAQEIEKRKRLAETSRQQQENERRSAILQQMKEEQEKQRRDQMIVQAKKLEQVKQQKRQASAYKLSPARQRIDAEYAQQPWGRGDFGSKSKYANYALQQQQRQAAAQPSYLKNRLNQAVQREEEPENDHDALAESILDGFDTDGDGQISYYELMDHVGAENHKSPEFQGLLNADQNGDMYITLEELASRLKNVDAEAKKVQKQSAGPNSQHVQIAASIMENLDANGDGKVSLQELVSNLKDEHHQHPDFKGWHAGFKEADADSDMHLTIQELAHLFKAMDDDEQEL